MRIDTCDIDSGYRHGRLLCLTHDEAAFVDAAFARILGSNCPKNGAAYVDLKLWETDRFALRAETQHAPHAAEVGRKATYQAGIGAVQAHAVRKYGQRFQQLCGEQQDALLALLEADDGRGDIAEHQPLCGMLMNDAAEAYFSQPGQHESRDEGAAC